MQSGLGCVTVASLLSFAETILCLISRQMNQSPGNFSSIAMFPGWQRLKKVILSHFSLLSTGLVRGVLEVLYAWLHVLWLDLALCGSLEVVAVVCK